MSQPKVGTPRMQGSEDAEMVRALASLVVAAGVAVSIAGLLIVVL
jgi:hypothetical protein